MPILTVKVSARKSAELTRAISGILSELTTRILKKKPEVTSIAIDYVHSQKWASAASISISRSPMRPTPKPRRRNISGRRSMLFAAC
jgi:phenylpyruvate tautomerase PptA (4-oxalocrotonate tautomerase family)